jgi:hypothetical protein
MRCKENDAAPATGETLLVAMGVKGNDGDGEEVGGAEIEGGGEIWFRSTEAHQAAALELLQDGRG